MAKFPFNWISSLLNFLARVNDKGKHIAEDRDYSQPTSNIESTSAVEFTNGKLIIKHQKDKIIFSTPDGREYTFNIKNLIYTQHPLPPKYLSLLGYWFGSNYLGLLPKGKIKLTDDLKKLINSRMYAGGIDLIPTGESYVHLYNVLHRYPELHFDPKSLWE